MQRTDKIEWKEFLKVPEPVVLLVQTWQILFNGSIWFLTQHVLSLWNLCLCLTIGLGNPQPFTQGEKKCLVVFHKLYLWIHKTWNKVEIFLMTKTRQNTQCVFCSRVAFNKLRKQHVTHNAVKRLTQPSAPSWDNICFTLLGLFNINDIATVENDGNETILWNGNSRKSHSVERET